MVTLSRQDHLCLEEHGLNLSQIEAQLQQLRQGIPSLHLLRPCRIEDGIIQLSPKEAEDLHRLCHSAHAKGRVSKFIPASGAATRMFKDLLHYLDNEASELNTVPTHSSLPEHIDLSWKQLEQFPFIDHLQEYFSIQGKNLKNLYQQNHRVAVFQALLHQPGLGYAHLPKALLPFHQYQDHTRTALEEHVHEAMMYGDNPSERLRIHLTVSAPFETQVREHIETIQKQSTQNGLAAEISVSIQKPSTNTIALDNQGQPFRNSEGTLLFRPGGHGALLENLNDYKADIVCISNIDNVVPDYLKQPVVDSRMSLIGYLLKIQEQVFEHLKHLYPGKAEAISKAETFIRNQLHTHLPRIYHNLNGSRKIEWLQNFLDRPIRVCGMVQNTGEAGGGPFWVQETDGSQSRQIVEQSQADPHSIEQQKLFTTSTHFNPVDMVCGLRDYQGNPFNLLNFRDLQTTFISQKTYQGRPLKALEWPGLWNGGMSNWITLFVEIPRTTFNPVKTYLDWLHPNHQPPSTSLPSHKSSPVA